jgi:ABC-type lipoprotein release transport system permease subunit
MGLTFRLAWRNLFRNKRRTVIAGIAIGVGLAALMFTDALIEGMMGSLVESATASYLGEGQIHARGFRLTQDVNQTIRRPDGVIAGLAGEPSVEAWAPRAESFGMITSPANVSAVLVVGVDPGKERALSRVDDRLTQGAFFEGADAGDLVIGSGLADLLEVGLGDRLVVTVAQAGTGALAQDLFRVSGIYRFGIKEMDEGLAFVRLARAQAMLGIGRGLHEIALKFRTLAFATEKNNPFWAKYSADGNEAVSWTVLLPQLEGVLRMVWVWLAFMAVVLFGIVAFGIINTLFMSFYERLFEFGVLRAVGTRATGVGRLVVSEAGALGLLSVGLGAILGLALIGAISKIGIDYRGIELAGTTFADRLYPIFRLRQVLVYPAAVFLFTVLMGFYPAVVAARMRVAEALRKSF